MVLVTATLPQARGDLEQYLPVAAALIPQPDTSPGLDSWQHEIGKLLTGSVE